MTLINSTVTDNVAETGSGGGIRNIGTFAELVNTIIAVKVGGEPRPRLLRISHLSGLQPDWG